MALRRRRSSPGSRACSITAPCRPFDAWSSKLTSCTSRRSSEASVTCMTDRWGGPPVSDVVRCSAGEYLHAGPRLAPRLRFRTSFDSKDADTNKDDKTISVFHLLGCCRKLVQQVSRPPSCRVTTWSPPTVPTDTPSPVVCPLKRSWLSWQVRREELPSSLLPQHLHCSFLLRS